MATTHMSGEPPARPASVAILRRPSYYVMRWILMIAVLIVGSVVAVSIEAIYTTSAHQVEALTLLKSVESLANRLNGIEWQLTAQGTSTPELSKELGAVRLDLEQTLAELAQAQPGYHAKRVVKLGTQYMQGSAGQTGLSDGEGAAPGLTWKAQTDPAYAALVRSINEASIVYRQQSKQAAMVAHTQAAALLMVAIALLAFLFWCFEWAQRKAERLSAEHLILRASEERFRSLVENASDIILTCTASGTIHEASPASQRVWGRPPSTLHERKLEDLVYVEDRARMANLVMQALNSPATPISSELRFHHVDGSTRHCDVIANNLLADQGIKGIVVTCRDITERKVFEEQLARLAFHDSLSNLPNRSLFISRLRHALVRKERSATSHVAVLFLDLDNFKIINDSLGHQAGDQLLIAVAERVQTCVRPVDTVARLGGDEFTVLLDDVSDLSHAVDVAERIQQVLGSPFSIGGQDVYTGASIGIALSRPDQYRPDDLLRDADLAMYRAKTEGKAHYAVFDQSLTDRALERMELETDLRRAIERRELTIYYQPVVSLESNRVCEVEALVRWVHPTRGVVAPSAFIPVAEETRLILPIGQWVLTEACRQAVEWQSTYPEMRSMIMSVNLSPRQFQEPDLVAVVAGALRETQLEPQYLKLEITESMMLRDSDTTTTTLYRLKQLGVQLAIDDFGTGYCSLNYLKRLPVDTLKIDRSFINGLGHNAEDTAIVRAVVAFAKALMLSVTGEGVETAEQLAQLNALECERGQGYFFSKPLPGHEVSAFFDTTAHGLPQPDLYSPAAAEA